MASTVALIATGPPDISEFGLRSIAAYLKTHGIAVRSIFLPGGVERLRHRTDYIYQYQHTTLNSLKHLLSDVDLVGFSLMSNYLDRAAQVSGFIRKHLDVPIVWGGIHPTVKPLQSLKYCDFVVRGEGEDAMLELVENLAQGNHTPSVRNVWYKAQGRLVRHEQRPFISDINKLPYMDYALDDAFITDLTTHEVVPLTAGLFEKTLLYERPFGKRAVRTLKIYASRGCPFKCSYCANSTLYRLSPGKGYFRVERVERMIDRLCLLKEAYPFIGAINIFDDVFTARPDEDIERFCALYDRHISLPFQVQVTPKHINKRILKRMLTSGLYYVEMGIQSISDKAQSLYKRRVKSADIQQAAQLIHAHGNKMNAPCYHVILDNPWETREDVLQTIDLLLALPKGYWLKRASLTLFPGTTLYEKAKQEGLMIDEFQQIYRKNLITPEVNYLNFLVYLCGKAFVPRFMIHLLKKPLFFRLFEHPLLYKPIRAVMWLVDTMELAGKGLKALLKWDIPRIIAYIKRVR